MAESEATVSYFNSPCPMDEVLAVSIMHNIGEYSDQDTLCDFDVVVEGEIFRCHRLLLSSMSRYFYALCNSGMKESREKSVTLFGLTPATFRLVLDVITKARDVLNESNCFELWHAANQLDIPLLLERCENFALKMISAENCLQIFGTATLLDSSRVANPSWEFILEHFDTMRLHEGILDMNYLDFKCLITNQNLKARNEDHVIDVILKWIHHPLEQNKKDDAQASQDLELLNKYSLFSDKKMQGNCRHPVSNKKKTKKQKRNEKKECQTEDRIQDSSAVAALKTRRTDYLPDLLWAARICLVSEKSLRKLLDNDLVIRSEPALSCVKLGISFLNEAKGYCPPQALYRSTSKLLNGIVYLDQLQQTLNFMDTDRNIFCLQNISCTVVQCGALIDRHFFVIVAANNAYCFSLFDGNISTLPLKWETTPVSVKTLAAVDNCVYLIGNPNTTEESQLIINRFTAMEAILCGSAVLEPVDVALVNVISPKAAVLGANIIVLGTDPSIKNTIVVIGFNTETMSPFRMDDLEESSSSVVTFVKDDELFILFPSGSLWKITEVADGQLSVQRVTTLWDFNRDLRGVVLLNNELFIFGDKFSSINSSEWHISVAGVFLSIRNMATNGNYFQYAVMPKTVLHQR